MNSARQAGHIFGRQLRVLCSRRLNSLHRVFASGEIPTFGNITSREYIRIVGLHVEREVLLRRIEQRVEGMYAAGLLDEARELLKLDLSQTALQAIGYAEAFGVLNNDWTLEQAKEKTIIRTRQLAKRQMTWFRNQLNIEWIDTAEFQTLETLAEAVSNAWKIIGPTPVVFD